MKLKVKVVCSSDDDMAYYESGYWEAVFFTIPGNVEETCNYRVNNLCDCPEDAIIPRDLISAYEYLEILELGMQLGAAGYTEAEVEDCTFSVDMG